MSGRELDPEEAQRRYERRNEIMEDSLTNISEETVQKVVERRIVEFIQGPKMTELVSTTFGKMLGDTMFSGGTGGDLLSDGFSKLVSDMSLELEAMESAKIEKSNLEAGESNKIDLQDPKIKAQIRSKALSEAFLRVTEKYIEFLPTENVEFLLRNTTRDAWREVSKMDTVEMKDFLEKLGYTETEIIQLRSEGFTDLADLAKEFIKIKGNETLTSEFRLRLDGKQTYRVKNPETGMYEAVEGPRVFPMTTSVHGRNWAVMSSR